jgi:hypothetical protein
MSCPEILYNKLFGMTEKKSKKCEFIPKANSPIKRRTEEEINKILFKIQNKGLSKRLAYLKYGMNSNTLNLYIIKQSVAQIIRTDLVNLSSIINDNQKNTTQKSKST